MGDPIRIVVADDSSVARRVIGKALDGIEDIEIVGTGANGQQALEKVARHHPDAIVLDVEMPVMDGLEAVSRIRDTDRKIPIVMFSAYTSKGAEVTIDALSRGASAYVTKPTADHDLESAISRIRDELPPLLRALVHRPTDVSERDIRRRFEAGEPMPQSAIPTPPAPAPPGTAQPPKSREPIRINVIALGISTGGPRALAEVIPNLPRSLAVPILAVQHMPPEFTRALADRLDQTSDLTVREAQGGESPAPGEMWIAPGGRHLEVRSRADGVRLVITDGPPENSSKPSVDVLFRSVATVYGERALGVVMTGMGYDGMLGSGVIRSSGGQVIVQDEASSTVWGMPGSTANAGHADAIVPLDDMAAELHRRSQIGR